MRVQLRHRELRGAAELGVGPVVTNTGVEVALDPADAMAGFIASTQDLRLPARDSRKLLSQLRIGRAFSRLTPGLSRLA